MRRPPGALAQARCCCCCTLIILAAAAAAAAPWQADDTRLRVAIVNQEPFHFEVLAGFMHLVGAVLPSAAARMTVYMQRRRLNANNTLVIGDYGFQQLIRPYARHVTELPAPLARHDVLIFISPEYNMSYVASAVQEARPRLVVHVVHNADTPLLRQLAASHANTQLLALAPHVVGYMKRRAAAAGEEGVVALGHEPAVGGAEWMLPTLPFRAKDSCLPPLDVSKCLSGFTIQGKINRHKRNYTHVFEQLMLAREGCQGVADCTKRLELHLVGALWTRLFVPPDAQPFVHRRHYLKFPVFYELIHHTLALVPAVSSRQYYESKFSSTVISSLVTGVPLLADRALLAPYAPLLNSSHVVLQGEDESLAACMLRVLRQPARQLADTRVALLRLQRELNQEAGDKMMRLLKPLMRRRGRGRRRRRG